jgi:muconolactone delta-isomerase
MYKVYWTEFTSPDTHHREFLDREAAKDFARDLRMQSFTKQVWRTKPKIANVDYVNAVVFDVECERVEEQRLHINRVSDFVKAWLEIDPECTVEFSL